MLFAAAAVAVRAEPIAVTYTATQTNGSEWRYDYRVSGSLSAQSDLAIYFPLATSSALSDLSTADPAFTTFVLQPDPAIPADGEFDLIANADQPSVLTAFSVSFQYAGVTLPGSQAFTVYDPSFDVVSTGETTAAGSSVVPEPASLFLLASGMAGLWKVRRRLR